MRAARARWALAVAGVLALAGNGSCGDETSVELTLNGGPQPIGDSLCVAVTADGEPAFNQSYSLADSPLPQTLTVAAGTTHRTGFTVTAAIAGKGRELARASQTVRFADGVIGQASLDLAGCQPRSVPGSFKAGIALLGAPTGNGRRMVAADFDGDGRLDLAIAAPGKLVLLLGHGDGTFSDDSTARLPEGAAPAAPGVLAAFDLDGDCRLDLVIGDTVQGLSWLHNQGDGRFDAPQGIGSGAGVRAVDAGDVNGDGRLDLVAVGPGGDRVILGGASFEERQVPGGSGDAVAVGLGDMDADEAGVLDLGVIPAAKGIRTYTGDGSGNFVSFEGVAAVDEMRTGGAVLDLTGDGLVDLISAGPAVPTRVYVKRGAGIFDDVGGGLPANLSLVVVGDIDGDCSPDVLVSDAGSVRFFVNPGRDAQFVERPFPSLGAADALAIGDFNGDGAPDVAVLGAQPGLDTVFLQ